MTAPDPATAAYFTATADGPFDHQRDAYEQGYQDGAAHRPCMLCDDLRAATARERQRIREGSERHYEMGTNIATRTYYKVPADLLDGAS